MLLVGMKRGYWPEIFNAKYVKCESIKIYDELFECV